MQKDQTGTAPITPAFRKQELRNKCRTVRELTYEKLHELSSRVQRGARLENEDLWFKILYIYGILPNPPTEDD